MNHSSVDIDSIDIIYVWNILALEVARELYTITIQEV